MIPVDELTDLELADRLMALATEATRTATQLSSYPADNFAAQAASGRWKRQAEVLRRASFRLRARA